MTNAKPNGLRKSLCVSGAISLFNESLKRKFNQKTIPLAAVIGVFLLAANISFSQPCPVTPCNAPHQTLVNLANVPLCGSGTLALDGDVQSNQTDCLNNDLNCHEFIVFRAPNSLTQQFTVKVGQGSGCTGELDASYA